jgi:hypothetical protein
MILSMVTGLPIRYIGWENIPLGQRQKDRATAGRQFFNELIDRQTVLLKLCLAFQYLI